MVQREAMTHGPNPGRRDRVGVTGEPGPHLKGDVMRTLRLTVAGMVLLALLGGLGGAVAAQAEDEGSGLITEPTYSPLDQGDEPDGTYWYAGLVEASDPRLSGTWTENWRCQPGSGFEVCVGAVRVENEGGTWLGRVEGFNHPGGAYDWTVLEGQGGYDGMTAIRFIGEEPDDEGVVEMVLLDFEMPAQPEPYIRE